MDTQINGNMVCDVTEWGLVTESIFQIVDQVIKMSEWNCDVANFKRIIYNGLRFVYFHPAENP